MKFWTRVVSFFFGGFVELFFLLLLVIVWEVNRKGKLVFGNVEEGSVGSEIFDNLFMCLVVYTF